jgi:hypothetical protein
MQGNTVYQGVVLGICYVCGELQGRQPLSNGVHPSLLVPCSNCVVGPRGTRASL